MEKKKNSIVMIIYLLLIIILCGFIVYKLVINHESRLYNVLYSEIKYKAKKCYLDKKCDENMYLYELYDKKYLDTMYDPISKEELNKNIKIKIKDKDVIIDK